tara:strand:+ start:206 stop:874 length:669 start_codon:yes stop_codon:yes gene_type:complete
MGRKDLVARIEDQNVVIKLNFQEKKTVLKGENSLAIQIEAEENRQRIGMVKTEINMEIRKNHILEIKIPEVDLLEKEVAEDEEEEVEVMVTVHLEKEVVEDENTVIDPLEIEKEAEVILLETEVAEVETNMVTNLLEIEAEVAESMVTNLPEEEVAEAEEEEVAVIMEIETVETIIEAETLGINRAQAKNSTVERKILVKSENPKIRAIEITNVNLNNYSKV